MECKEATVTVPTAGEVVSEQEQGNGGDVPNVHAEIYELILNHSDRLTLVSSVQRVCNAWRDAASKILRQRLDDLIRQVGLVPPSEMVDKDEGLVTSLQWECNESEQVNVLSRNTQLIVSIQEGGDQQPEPSKVWTRQQVYQGDLFQEFFDFNGANTTSFPRCIKCKERLNTQALQELIKMMVLASGPIIRQERSSKLGPGYTEFRWSDAFYFTPNTTSASWASVLENKAQTRANPSGEERASEITLRFHYHYAMVCQ